MKIRQLAEDELDALLALYQDLHQTDDPLPGRDRVEAVWRKILENPGLYCCGAYLDGILVASCMLSVIPNLTRGCRPYGVIENVVTRRDFRKKGYGKAVLEHALGQAWQQGCYKVMLMTGRKNEETYRFYSSAGFDRHAKQAFLARP